MTLTHLLVFSATALLAGVLVKERGRGWMLLVGSLLAIYWMQPASPIRNLDFWLPSATVAVAVIGWAATRSGEDERSRENLISGIVIALVVIAVGLTRYLEPLCCLTPTRPPQATQIIIAIIFTGVLIALIAWFFPKRGILLNLLFFSIIAIFLVLKTEGLAQAASAWLRTQTRQSTNLASGLDIGWLGFSYVAFRLLHTLRDRLTGRLPDVSLQEFVIYVIFFPAFTAGPIDRLQRFIKDLRKSFNLGSPEMVSGARRILVGVFKKFVLADSLALVALNQTNASQTSSTFWMWVLLYAYTFRIYFDFSGYTDIAIGIGQLLGFQLPENFTQPYLKTNLTAFWNSWHITLAKWFRAYFFNPLTRFLRSRQNKLPLPIIILISQISTMVLLGLWHGVTWNFVIWGAWHGFGLFIHNRWAEFAASRNSAPQSPGIQKLYNWSGIFLTFNFVALGWVWFFLPTPSLAWRTLQTLAGI
ncbi:MAG: MBOAT family protein [Chloroflexi bacterium]|nr:MBOAT family protein [Chloroflexota bacterium]